MVQQKGAELPIFKTVAPQSTGIIDIADFISSHKDSRNNRKEYLLAEKAYKLIQQKRMAGIDKAALQKNIAGAMSEPGFNLYSFIEKIL